MRLEKCSGICASMSKTVNFMTKMSLFHSSFRAENGLMGFEQYKKRHLCSRVVCLHPVIDVVRVGAFIMTAAITNYNID